MREARKRIRLLEQDAGVMRRAVAYLPGCQPKMMYPLVRELAVDGVPVTVTLGVPPAKSEACGGTGIAVLQTRLLSVASKPGHAT